MVKKGHEQEGILSRLMRACPIPPSPRDLIRIERSIKIRDNKFSGLMRVFLCVSFLSFLSSLAIGYAYQGTMLVDYKSSTSGLGAGWPWRTLWRVDVFDSHTTIPMNLWLGDEVTIQKTGYRLNYLNESLSNGVEITATLIIFPPGFDPNSIAPHPIYYYADSYDEFAVYTYQTSHNFTHIGETAYLDLKALLKNTALNLREGEKAELKCIIAESVRTIYKNGSLDGPATGSEIRPLLVKNPDSLDRVQRSMYFVGAIGSIITGSLLGAIVILPLVGYMKAPGERVKRSLSKICLRCLA